MSDIKDTETFVKWHDTTYPDKARMYSLVDLYKAFNAGLNIKKESHNINLISIKTKVYDILQTLEVMAIQEKTNEVDNIEDRDFVYAYDWFCDESRNINYQLKSLHTDIEKRVYNE